MSQGAWVTLIGFVAREPTLRTTKDGRMVADVRVGATTGFYDKVTDQWRVGDTSYYTVNCWRRLAGHVRASLHKGDPVMVKGRFRTHTYEDRQNRIRTEVEIIAETIGHDLSRGIANYMRPERPHQADVDNRAAEDAEEVAAHVTEHTTADMADGDLVHDVRGADLGAGDPEDLGPEVDDDDAAEELNRDLERELAEGGQLAPL